MGGERILAVLEPRSNTMKLGTMKAALPASLADADLVFCSAANLGWDPGEALAELGERAQTFDDFDALLQAGRRGPARRPCAGDEQRRLLRHSPEVAGSLAARGWRARVGKIYGPFVLSKLALAVQLAGDAGDTLAIGLGGVQIALRDFVDAGVGRRLHQQANRTAQIVDVLAAGVLGVAGQQAQADPQAAVLGSQGLQVDQRNRLSPFRLALLVKPPNTLSCQPRVNQTLELASANFLNCQLGLPI